MDFKRYTLLKEIDKILEEPKTKDKSKEILEMLIEELDIHNCEPPGSYDDGWQDGHYDGFKDGYDKGLEDGKNDSE